METTPPITIHTTQPYLSDEILGLIKVGSTLLTITAIIIAVWSQRQYFRRPQALLTEKGLTPITAIKYTPVLYPELGSVPNPIIQATLNGNNKSAQIDFILDSGAIITAIPSEYVRQLDLTLDGAQRIILSSLTTKTIFGYIKPVVLTINDQNLEIPVAFADVSTPVIGRHGFFDKYTLIFDHQQQALTIATN